MPDDPAIQLISNLVVYDDNGRVLLAQYEPTNEGGATGTDARWWLPAHELDAYQHPDEAAQIAIDEIAGVEIDSIELRRVQSFRGRRGWHVSFDYAVHASGQPTVGPVPAGWFDRAELPPTMHGNWETDTIDAVLD